MNSINDDEYSTDSDISNLDISDTTPTTTPTTSFYRKIISEETEQNIKENGKICFSATKNKLFHLFTDHPASRNMT